MFIAKLSTLLKPAEQEVKSKRVKEEPVEVVVELTPQQKRNRSIVRLPTIALDGGTAAREFQKYDITSLLSKFTQDLYTKPFLAIVETKDQQIYEHTDTSGKNKA